MCRAERWPLLLCTTGPKLDELHAMLQIQVPAADRSHVRVLSSVPDEDRPWLYHHCAAFALPSKPTPEFTETFGIVLAEKALAGGSGPTLATRTGCVYDEHGWMGSEMVADPGVCARFIPLHSSGMPEATGGHCLDISPGCPASITQQLDRAHAMSEEEKGLLSRRAQEYARRFEHRAVFRDLLRLAEEGVVAVGV